MNTTMNILTGLIAIITTLILILQYRLASLRWRLALYDKRYPVFTDTMEYIASIVQTGTVTAERTSQFLHETMAKEFLFGQEIHDFLEPLFKKGVDLRTAQDIINAKAGVDEEYRKTIVYEAGDILKWFGDQLDVAKTVFEPYLRIQRK
jgi:hypothetical protein